MRRIIVLVTVLSLIATNILAADPAKKKAKKQAAGDDRGVSVVAKGGGKRVALVIGNGSYRYTDSLPKLTNPVNDADDMAAALRRFGFEVIAKKNLTKEEMDETITDFGLRIANSDAALFYYAGHGLQVKGQNYLVPVDANIDSEAKVPYRAVNVNLLLEEMESSRSRVNIVMLDACRNNPISGKFRSGATRGLAAPSATPKGTVIVYATDPGNVAADGSGRNGLFTAGLLTAFRGSDLTLGAVLYAASKQVQDATGQQQTPYINGPATVQREFSFVPLSEMTDLRPSEVQPQPLVSRPEPAPVPTSHAFKDPTTGMEFVPVPGGCFQMGDTFGDNKPGLVFSSDEHPVHEVCLSEFNMGKYEVTQGEWQQVMEIDPSQFKKCGDTCPVESVSWNDVQEFIGKLNRRSSRNYRLPTEAEWEYAARSGGKSEKYSGRDNIDAVAWYDGNSEKTTHPVGRKHANGLGLYDMSGNVWEWVWDWYDSKYYSNSPRSNPQGSATGSDHVFRGGGWRNGPAAVRASNRSGDGPADLSRIGFRLVAPVK